jgi:2-polyprenyl-6-methoxyphenol hydroxylase-like FAD-dependent oxidoreductase
LEGQVGFKVLATVLKVDQKKNVLISGAGVAGPTLAFWLKAAGFKPTLIERAPSLRTGGYVIDLWGLGYDIAERMGLSSAIERVGYHVQELRIVNHRGERLTGFGTRVFRELTGGRFVTVGRGDLSRLLFEIVRNDTEVIFGEEIVTLTEDEDCIRVRLKQSGERCFDLLIGTDGLHSEVRRLAFGPEESFEKHLGYVVAAFEADGYRPRDEEVYVIYCEPGRMVTRFAMHDDRTLFLFVFAADDSFVPMMLDKSGQRALLRRKWKGCKWETTRILCELDHARDIYFDRVSQIKMESWSRGRVALVGDAAFCLSLMAGQGAGLAMTAAYVLAGELAKAGGHHEVAFRNYELALGALIAAKQRGAERFAAAFAPRTAWGLFLRNQVIKAFAIPGVARAALRRDVVDNLKLTEYGWPSLPTPDTGASMA